MKPERRVRVEVFPYEREDCCLLNVKTDGTGFSCGCVERTGLVGPVDAAVKAQHRVTEGDLRLPTEGGHPGGVQAAEAEGYGSAARLHRDS